MLVSKNDGLQTGGEAECARQWSLALRLQICQVVPNQRLSEVRDFKINTCLQLQVGVGWDGSWLEVNHKPSQARTEGWRQIHQGCPPSQNCSMHLLVTRNVFQCCPPVPVWIRSCREWTWRQRPDSWRPKCSSGRERCSRQPLTWRHYFAQTWMHNKTKMVDWNWML